MTLDPRVSLYLNVILAVLMGLAGATTELTNLFGEHGSIIAMAVIAILIAAINAILHAIPSKDTPDATKTFYLGPKQ